MSKNTLQTYLEWLIQYRDKYGLLVNKDRDGGDCAHNTGIYYISIANLESLTEYYTPPALEFQRELSLLGGESQYIHGQELKPGQYVRHCDPSLWYSRLRYMSRDQLKSLMAAVCYFKLESTMRFIYNDLKSNKFMHHNNYEYAGHAGTLTDKKKIADLPSPTQFGFFIRTLPELKKYRFLLPLLDLDLLYGSLISYKKWDGGIKVFTEILAVEKTGSHSFVSRIAAYLLKKRVQLPQLLEESYTVHSLAIPPLGLIVRESFLKWVNSGK